VRKRSGTVLSGPARLNRRHQVCVACHFFAPDEIEFDIQPREVNGPERLSAVAAFLRELASATRMPALLTMENMQTAVILRAHPATGSHRAENLARADALLSGRAWRCGTSRDR
jgi:hypothetical protein